MACVTRRFKAFGFSFSTFDELGVARRPNVHVYIDDIIVGSEGDTDEELIANHEKDVFRVLEASKKRKLC
jgi:hypothetical protein